jgi:hypothetical protein
MKKGKEQVNKEQRRKTFSKTPSVWADKKI